VAAAPFEVAASLATVVASIRPQAERKGLELVVSHPPDIGRMVGDRRRLEQILLNLLSNAVKFTEHGRVTLTAEPVDGYRPGGQGPPVPGIRLVVTDTGVGIRDSDLPSLFVPFHQIDSGLARQHEGTGLGLAICRRLASLMGGEISVASEWLRGSTFTVLLPRKGPAAP
jgi:signal transduction histidine kinase